MTQPVIHTLAQGIVPLAEAIRAQLQDPKVQADYQAWLKVNAWRFKEN